MNGIQLDRGNENICVIEPVFKLEGIIKNRMGGPIWQFTSDENVFYYILKNTTKKLLKLRCKQKDCLATIHILCLDEKMYTLSGGRSVITLDKNNPNVFNIAFYEITNAQGNHNCEIDAVQG